MRRLNDEHGAVAVIVALLMVPLMGFAALAIDMAALYSDRQQLQTAADAAALGIAGHCQRDVGAMCSATNKAASQGYANDYLEANLNAHDIADGGAVATVVSLTGASVTVTMADVRKHTFGPILGVPQGQVSASATVEWGGNPISGIAKLPLTFNLCEFNFLTGGGIPSDTIQRTIYFAKTASTNCAVKPGAFVPGGFGWVDVNSGTCMRQSSTTGTLSLLESNPGNSPPSSCTDAYFASLQGQTVLLPLFDNWGGTGNNAYYEVYQYAAFKITGYYFASNLTWPNPPPCGGSDRCIRGFFTTTSVKDSSFTYGAGGPNLGVSGPISLTN